MNWASVFATFIQNLAQTVKNFQNIRKLIAQEETLLLESVSLKKISPVRTDQTRPRFFDKKVKNVHLKKNILEQNLFLDFHEGHLCTRGEFTSPAPTEKTSSTS